MKSKHITADQILVLSTKSDLVTGTCVHELGGLVWPDVLYGHLTACIERLVDVTFANLHLKAVSLFPSPFSSSP